MRAVGGSLLAAEQALAHGLACHLAGGTHHADYAQASGYCIFNDLAVIAHYLLASGQVGRVLIFDCDVHQGDGTARLLADTAEAITVSLHCEKNFPARKAASDWDIPLPIGMGDADYLRVVDDSLNYLLPLYQPDLVLYDAGVDVHQDDALGYLNLTDAGLAARDAETRRRTGALAAKGVVGRREDLDFIVAAGAAAEAAGARGVATQLLAMEARRVELLVGLEIGKCEAAQGDEVADQVEAVAALDTAAGRRVPRGAPEFASAHRARGDGARYAVGGAG